MTAKHTPGPWAFDGESRIDALQFRKLSPHKYKDDDGIECEFMEGLVALPYSCGDNGTHEANARLIAAAPDLLEALEGLRQVCNIALTGKNGTQHTYFETRSGHFVEATKAMQAADSAIAKATGATA